MRDELEIVLMHAEEAGVHRMVLCVEAFEETVAALRDSGREFDVDDDCAMAWWGSVRIVCDGAT